MKHVPGKQRSATPEGEVGALSVKAILASPSRIFSLVGVAFTIAVIWPTQTLVLLLAPSKFTAIPQLFHRMMTRSFGVRRHVTGQVSNRPATVFICNHISWLDIFVLGSEVRGSFVAKDDVAGWGMFGKLARLQRTIFISRQRRQDSAVQRDEITERLREGYDIMLFPEGTSGLGLRTLPFKSALFSVVDAARAAGVEVSLQPVTLAYTHINAMPVLRANRHEISWVGDMEFLPHVLHVMGLGRIKAHLVFHDVISWVEGETRKTLAAKCEQIIDTTLRQLNSGRFDAS